MENKDPRLAVDPESDASNTSRRQIGAAILGIFGGAVLSGCASASTDASAEESGAAPTMLGQSAEALNSGTNLKWFDTITGASPSLKTTAGAAWQVAVAEGYSAAGDGGGGVFF